MSTVMDRNVVVLLYVMGRVLSIEQGMSATAAQRLQLGKDANDSVGTFGERAARLAQPGCDALEGEEHRAHGEARLQREQHLGEDRFSTRPPLGRRTL